MVEFFNLESYYSTLKTRKLGRPCIYLEQCDSTINAIANEPSNTIVLAKEQLKGRGQRGNVWQSPPGCAMASIKLVLNKQSFLSSKLCFLQHIMALTIANTLEQIDKKKLGQNRIQLKWPNDVIYNDGKKLKIAGILVNTLQKLEDLDVILSFGLNVFNKQPTTCINEILDYPSNQQIRVDFIVAEMLNNLENCIDKLDDGSFELIKSEYTSRCLQINQVVNDHVNGPVEVKEVNDDGYLVGVREYDKKYCVVTKIV